MTDKYTLEFPPSDDEYRATAEKQKAYAVAVAGKLLQNDALTEDEATFAAAILKQWADDKAISRPKTKGRQPRLNPSDVALNVGMLIREKGMEESEAIKMLADHYNMSDEAVRKALNKKKAAAMRYWQRVPTK